MWHERSWWSSGVIRCGSIIIEQGRNAGRRQKVQRVLNNQQPGLGFTRAEALAPPQTQPDCPVGCARGLERPDPAGDRAAALAQRRTQLFGVPILRVQDETQLSLGAPADHATLTDPSRGPVPPAAAPGRPRGRAPPVVLPHPHSDANHESSGGSPPGSHIVNVLPDPRVLSTVIWPPCSSASSRTIARPSPLPPRSRLRD